MSAKSVLKNEQVIRFKNKCWLSDWYNSVPILCAKIAYLKFEVWELIIWTFLLVLVFHRNYDFWFFFFHVQKR